MYRFYSNPNGNGRVTVVGEQNGNIVTLAAARCSKKDQFVKKKGRAIAEGRLAKGGKSIFGTVEVTEERMTNDEFVFLAATAADTILDTPSTVTIGTLEAALAEAESRRKSKEEATA